MLLQNTKAKKWVQSCNYKAFMQRSSLPQNLISTAWSLPPLSAAHFNRPDRSKWRWQTFLSKRLKGLEPCIDYRSADTDDGPLNYGRVLITPFSEVFKYSKLKTPFIRGAILPLNESRLNLFCHKANRATFWIIAPFEIFESSFGCIFTWHRKRKKA